MYSAQKAMGVLLLITAWNHLQAQTPASSPSTQSSGSNMIRLTFPENMEIKALAEYVSGRLNINVLYDEQIGAKRLTIKSPADVPKDSLLGLFQSALRMKGLVLVDADQPGWKKIVPSQDLLAASKTIFDSATTLPADLSMGALTQIVRLKNTTPQAVEQIIKPFLTQPGGNTLAIADQSILIVTDYARNFSRLNDLIRLADQSNAATIKFIPAKNVDAATLAQDTTKLLSEKYKSSSGKRPMPTVTYMARNSQVVVIGSQEQIAEVSSLIESLDVPSDVVTKVYQFQAASPERIEKLAREMIDPESAKTTFRSSVDKDAGLLIVTAPPVVHAKIESLKNELDVPAERQATPIRFYRLTNSTAAAVLSTIQSLQRSNQNSSALNGNENLAPSSPFGVMPPPPGANRPPGEIGQELPKPPGYADQAASQPSVAAPTVRTVQTADAIVTADANTNTIIVVAPPPVQQTYAQLIKMLDKRRPQVLLEVTLVTLDTSDSISIGVDMFRRSDCKDATTLTFSAFGLSTVDPLSASLTIKPGTGFNGALISPDILDVVVRALATSGKAKVLSAPKILVNDNATGTLASIAEAPFTSVNASNTVATTSFAGYASAGTTITVTPHISEGDHLQLKYSITLNSFTGDSSNGVPPPRQTNSVDSEVTIPDGYAVVVGGMRRLDKSHTAEKVPFLGDIPFLGLAFGQNAWQNSDKTLFVFIRPIILRDDNFEDLKYISDKDLEQADMPPSYPPSQPRPI